MDPSRRSFLRGKVSAPAKVARPPWALKPEADFLAACTRCDECVTRCPQQVLIKGDGGYPEIRFNTNGCTLCGECAVACVPRAIDRERVPQAFAERIRLLPGCLHEKGVECRVCGDACDVRALRFRPRIGGLALLEVEAEACTGCGACVPVCPMQVLQRG